LKMQERFASLQEGIDELKKEKRLNQK